jgi:3-oxoacyl-[acyl-carrier protein] reductase
MSKLEGKVAVVTGASKGIGAQIAKTLAAEGAAVVVNYATDEAGAERVVATIIQQGGRAIAVQADVGKEADVRALFAETKRAFGRLDVLVNNAGVYRFGAIEAFAEEEFHRQFGTNVLGTFLTIREAVAHFGDGGGSVINVSSTATTMSLPTTSVYTATKAAVESLTRVLAKELGPRKIRVNAIAPGGTETEGVRAAGIIGTDFANQMVAQTPLGRFGQPDDIAPVALFLASADSGWVTGETLQVSGGLR